MKLKALIVDDEPLAREIIVSYLRDFEEIETVHEATNGIEAVEQINKLSPDLLFLDIEMPKMDGIAVLDSANLIHLPVVIFTTAYNQFAIKAFELNATDYLMKPFDRARFHASMNKALERIKLSGFRDFHEQWTKINLDYQNSIIQNRESKYPGKIVVKDSKRIKHILTDDIQCIQAAGDYIEIIDHAGKFLLYKSISEIESKLDPQKFRRIHKSYIINCEHIKEIRPHTNSEYYFHLTNQRVVKSGRTYKDKITDLTKGTF
ncbi:LytR/AlgR family response regulator transcription factor [Reichenbachiella sp.]|uniref:LytR/AlgR family response regulator transcription factor n=1 Tax=Reichenbachiella sp. TaxID=2184521 RepID=UPI003BB14487